MTSECVIYNVTITQMSEGINKLWGNIIFLTNNACADRVYKWDILLNTNTLLAS